jgi:uncharacterized MAPEG superfamily protein
MEQFSEYSHAIAALAIWALMMVVLAGLSTAGRTDADRCDCGKPKRDYSSSVYRRERAFANAIENSGPFIAGTLAAILAGASPLWVNVLTSVFLISRLVMAAVHIGTENQAMRSAAFMVSWLCLIVLAVVAVFAVF